MNRHDKEELLQRLHTAVTSPLTIGGLATSFNLSDIYTHFSNREEVLGVLQDRFPHALAEMPSLDAQAWYEKISSLQRPRSYVSAYAGEVGEREAIAALEDLGIEATQFSSLTHRANDLIDSDGIEYSVKSYDPDRAAAFVSLARRTPESQDYVVNQELYEKLEGSGRVAELRAEGIDILDGGFSHADHTGQAADVLERIGTQQDVTDSVLDDVPVVACIVGIASAASLGHRYLNGRASTQEVAMDLLGTCARFAAGSGGAMGGGAIGAAAGSAVLPILGTIIGGTIGGLLGSLGAREFVRGAVEWAKWGTTLEVFNELGERYRNEAPPACIDAVATSVFQRPRIVEFVEVESPRRSRFHRELDPGDPTPPTPAAVLWGSALARAESALPRIDDAAKRSFDALRDLCIKTALARFPRQKQSARSTAIALYGSFLVEVPFLQLAIPSQQSARMAAALEELKRNPNHPYRSEKPKLDIMRALALQMLIEGGPA